MTIPNDSHSRHFSERLREATVKAVGILQTEAHPEGHWEGELSASALSTATAVAAISLAQKFPTLSSEEDRSVITSGLKWLAQGQLPDGGWGDTDRSCSNIATSMLVRAAFRLAEADVQYCDVIRRLDEYLERQGNVAAVHARYGTDRTFSAPILTQCALAGLVPWNEVAPLPFELGCLPHRFYKSVRLPVVSYALPALIAIGQVKHVCDPSRSRLIRWIRKAATGPALRLLTHIQPESGGFLEAIPLTSFVVMSLLGAGHRDHPVASRGLTFLRESIRDDGSWPIDTNLATWVTTLSVHALGKDGLPSDQRRHIQEWLLDQQLQQVHPYTNAAPGGWAWTPLSGGVPDADDTPGAILAILELSGRSRDAAPSMNAVSRAIVWLLDLQNGDGGWPTFCRGWGTLPFDRSAADITAHVLRALQKWGEVADSPRWMTAAQRARIGKSIRRGFHYLQRTQRSDGSWLPLWFGNQHAPDDINPVYGTSRVLLAYDASGKSQCQEALRGREWLRDQQNPDGGWGGLRGIPSSIEETGLALSALLSAESVDRPEIQKGLNWLVHRVENTDDLLPAASIGFYFAKLWYYERLYPQIFTVAALRQACKLQGIRIDDESERPRSEPARSGTSPTD